MRTLVIVVMLLLVGCERQKPSPSTFMPQLSPGEFIANAPGGSGFGDWSPKTYCPAGTYATGFSLMIEASCGGDCDDTALNGIRLICSGAIDIAPTSIESGHRAWGVWHPVKNCPPGEALFSYSLGVEHYLGGGQDDTSANSLKMKCRKVGTYDTPEPELAIHGPFADTWTSWGKCPVNSVVIGLLTRDEKSQGTGDDTATNDVMFICARRRSA